MLLGTTPLAIAVCCARRVAAAVINMLSNAGFDSGAVWTISNPSGASSIANGKMQFRDAAGDGDAISQPVAGLTPGANFTIGGTISGRTGGVLPVRCGGTIIGTASANGPFSFTGAAGGDGTVKFGASVSSAVFDLDNVSCAPG